MNAPISLFVKKNHTSSEVQCSEGTIILDFPDEQEDEQVLDGIFVKQGLLLGTVQICHNETSQSICSDSWNNEEASVVCRQFGFSPYGNHLACFVVHDIYLHFSTTKLDTN